MFASNLFTIVARDNDSNPTAAKTIACPTIQHAYALAETLTACPSFAADWLGKPAELLVTYQCYHTLRHHGSIDARGVYLGAIQIALITAKNHCRFGGSAAAVDMLKPVMVTEHVTAVYNDGHATDFIMNVPQGHDYSTAEAKAIDKAKKQHKNVKASMANHYEQLRSELSGMYYRALERDTAEAIDMVTTEYSHDAREMVAAARNGLLNGIAKRLRIYDCYTLGYRSLNAWLGSERGASQHEMSTEFIMAAGGDIVSWNSVVASIIRGGDKWVPIDGANMDAETAERLGAAITKAMAVLNPTQRQIAEKLGDGKSQRQIADEMRRSPATVAGHVAAIRKAMADVLEAGEFASLLHSAQIAAAFGKAVAHMAMSNQKRTAEGAARKAAADKATQAERARLYRERKKAAKLAAIGGEQA